MTIVKNKLELLEQKVQTIAIVEGEQKKKQILKVVNNKLQLKYKK